MIAQFPLTVLYTQVVVHRKGLTRPGLIWTDDHVAQGFACADEIAAFGMPDQDGRCWLRLDRSEAAVGLDPNALWAVRVPFEITTSLLQVGTIGLLQDANVPIGQYGLTFQVLPGTRIEGEDYTFIIDLRFGLPASPAFAILKQGSELLTDTVLRTDADHA